MESEEKKQQLSFSLLGRMFSALVRLTRLVYKDRPLLIISLFILSVVMSVTPFLQSAASGFLINQLVEAGKIGEFGAGLYLGISFLVATTLIFPLFSVFYGYADFLWWHFLEEKMEFLFMRKKSEIDIGLHEDPKFSDLAHRVNEESYRTRNFIDRQFQMSRIVLGVIIASVIIISFQWWVFLIVFIGAIPEFIFEAKYGARVWGIHSANAEVRRRFWEVRYFFTPVRALTELKLFCNTKHFIGKAMELFDIFRKEQYQKESHRFKMNILASVISHGTIAFAAVWFVYEVVQGHIQIGTFTFVIASILSLRGNLSEFFFSIAYQYQDGLFVLDILKFLDTKPRIISPEHGFSLPKGKAPEIIFENVTFTYPDASSPTLKDFSLRIAPGEKVALIGVNGAGKTTLVKLLCRFYDVDKGRILLGGKDIRSIDLDSWYARLGVLFQEYMNYSSFSVSETIALGDTSSKISPARIKKAAMEGDANKFIEKWEKKYSQVLGKEFEGGVEPSIGQWQKIALARVFYRDPEVFVLDEPTSSIDAESEAKIFEKMESLSKNKTVILISHRFSTVRNADKIAVIENGRVSEEGSHEMLLEKNGMYAKLFQLQARGYR